MAWNGSNETGASAKSPRKSNRAIIASRRPYRYGLCAVLILVALGCAAIWSLFDGRRTTVHTYNRRDSARPSKIAAVKPIDLANAVHPRKTTTAKGKPLKVERPPQHVGEIRDGFILLSSGELYPVKSVITTRCDRVSLEDRAFDRFSDRLIGSLLTVEPGDGMLGSSEELYEGFDKEFEESLKFPIEINYDDPDDIKEMKKTVIEVRKELQERKAKGENLEQLMIDSRNQLLELATYRDELESQVDMLMKDNDFSERDAQDLVDAANKMLEERGAKPLDMPVAAIYAIRHFTESQDKQE